MTLTLHDLKPLHEVADIKRHAGKLRAHCLQRTIDRDPRGDRAVGEVGHATARAFCTARMMRFPRGGDPQLQLTAREISKQPFPGRKRRLREKRPASLFLQSRKA